MNISKILKLREKSGLTISTVCKKVGISESAWHKIIESGSTKVDTLERFAKAFEVPVSYFFDEESKDYKANDCVEPSHKLCPKCRENAQTIANLNKYIELLETQHTKRKKPAG